MKKFSRRDFLRLIASGSVSATLANLLSACGLNPVVTSSPAPEIPTQPPNGEAEIIFTDGVILTMDENHPSADAIAVKDDKNIAGGTNEEVLRHRADATSLVSLDGHTMMPGFVDAHSHIINASEGDIEKFAGIQAAAIQDGMTTTTEMSVTPDLFNRLKGYDHVRRVQLRYNTYMLYNTNCGEAFDKDWYKVYKQGENISPKIRNQGVKIFADGGSCNVPAVTFDYPGGYGMGDLYMTQDEMNSVVAEAQANGYQVAVHALGDRAVEQVQNAIAAALNGAPNTCRHRIEHNAVLHQELLPRYNQIGIVPGIFCSYATCWRVHSTSQFKYVVPVEIGTWEWPWRALLDANPGVKAAWHSDYPVFPEISPIAHLYGFVTRNQVADDGSICEAQDWLKQGALTVDEALHIMTINAAYALFREDEIGSLEAGKLADMIILSANPREIPIGQIKDLSVLMTMIGGHVQYCADGYESFCP